MGDQDKQLQGAGGVQGGGETQPNGLTKHQQAIIDYAMIAATTANRVQTEELATRTQHVVRTEIHDKFEQFTKVTTARKIMLALGGVLAFGAGFFVSNMLKPKQEMGPNHVDD